MACRSKVSSFHQEAQKLQEYGIIFNKVSKVSHFKCGLVISFLKHNTQSIAQDRINIE